MSQASITYYIQTKLLDNSTNWDERERETNKKIFVAPLALALQNGCHD